MNLNSKCKLGRKSHHKIPSLREGRDIISHLPDDIVARVLSFLETKQAIRTCVLSSRWRNLWKGITRMQLRGYRSDPLIFANLVEHVLENCSSTDFLAFELVCPLSIDLSRLKACISLIVSRKIERLILCANYWDPFELPELPLLQFILSFTKLEVLSLKSFDIQIPESVVSFPCLKTVDLHVRLPHSVAVVNRLLSSCPVLEEFHLFGYITSEVDSYDELKIDVSVTTLRKLFVELRTVKGSYVKKLNVIINTPNLEDLMILDDSFTKYVVMDLLRISDVYVSYDALSSDALSSVVIIDHIIELLTGVSDTEILTLSSDTICVLASALSYTWPTFPCLTKLIVSLCDFSGWACFLRLLHCAPFLNVLVLDLEAINLGDRPAGDGNVLYQWIQSNDAPKCLLEHLEIIGIRFFKGNEDELQIVEYLLNNAKVLEGMMIGYESKHSSEEVRQKLLMSPRASGNCEVEIFYEHRPFME